MVNQISLCMWTWCLKLEHLNDPLRHFPVIRITAQQRFGIRSVKRPTLGLVCLSTVRCVICCRCVQKQNDQSISNKSNRVLKSEQGKNSGCMWPTTGEKQNPGNELKKQPCLHPYAWGLNFTQDFSIEFNFIDYEVRSYHLWTRKNNAISSEKFGTHYSGTAESGV